MHAGGELGLGYQNYDMAGWVDGSNGGEPGDHAQSAGALAVRGSNPRGPIMTLDMIISIYRILWIFIISSESRKVS